MASAATKRLALAVCACVLAATSTAPLAAAAASSSSSSAPPPRVVAGKARVVDGDTLVINGERIRLYGVDAPESKQSCTDARGAEYACGAEAAKALEARVRAGGGTAECAVKERDQYGRFVASCALPGGLFGAQKEDAGDYMVRSGQAVAYRSITKEYVPQEDAARRSKQGIWQGDFEPPAKWRYEQRVAEGAGGGFGGEAAPARPSSSFSPFSPSSAVAARPAAAGKKNAPAASSSGCRIKGNISAKGERIYHLPDDITYEATRIDVSAGERYFCTEEEAAAAGWRASRAPKAAAAQAMTSGAGQRSRR